MMCRDGGPVELISCAGVGVLPGRARQFTLVPELRRRGGRHMTRMRTV